VFIFFLDLTRSCATIMVITYFIENCCRFRTKGRRRARAHIVNYSRPSIFFIFIMTNIAGKKINVGTAIEGVYNTYYVVCIIYNVICIICLCVCLYKWRRRSRFEDIPLMIIITISCLESNFLTVKKKKKRSDV